MRMLTILGKCIVILQCSLFQARSIPTLFTWTQVSTRKGASVATADASTPATAAAPKRKRAAGRKKPGEIVPAALPPGCLEILANTQANVGKIIESMSMLQRTTTALLAKMASLEQQVALADYSAQASRGAVSQQAMTSPLRSEMSSTSRSPLEGRFSIPEQGSATSMLSRASTGSLVPSPLGSGSKPLALGLTSSTTSLDPSPARQASHGVTLKVCNSLWLTP